MKNLVPLSLFLSVSVALTACGNDETKPEDAKDSAEKVVAQDQATTEPAEVETKVEAVEKVAFLTDAEALQKAEDSFKALPKFEGKPISVFQTMHFYDDGNGTGSIKLEVQDPNKPENIDHYEYDAETATWSEPQPVQISGDGDMSANLTPLNDIKFADVAKNVVPMWQEKVKEKELETTEEVPSHVAMVLWVPDQDRFWQSSMESPRARYTLRLNLDGSLKSFKKS